MASFILCTISFSWGSHNLQELTKNDPITKIVKVPSNTKSNKLPMFHLTLTEMALRTSTLATQGMVDFFKFGSIASTRSSSNGSKHSLLFSSLEWPQVFNASKAS